jgi:CHASE3 domain sensor protein
MFDLARRQRGFILAGNYSALDRLYEDRDRLMEALRQIARHTVNGQQSLSASVAKAALEKED